MKSIGQMQKRTPPASSIPLTLHAHTAVDSEEKSDSDSPPHPKLPLEDPCEYQRLYEAYWQLYPVKSEIGHRFLRQLTQQLQLLDVGMRAEMEAISLGASAAELLQNPSGRPTNRAGILSAVNNPATASACHFQGWHLRQYQSLTSQLENVLRLEHSVRAGFNLRDYFSDEQACITHLRTRLEHACWKCPKCESSRGDWLNSKGRWECRSCRYQAGVRHGTVMFRSKIPLVKWFQLIDLVCHESPLTAAELGRRVGIPRESTVLQLQATVRSVLFHPESDRLLAGIPSYRLQICHLNQMIPLPTLRPRVNMTSPAYILSGQS